MARSRVRSIRRPFIAARSAYRLRFRFQQAVQRLLDARPHHFCDVPSQFARINPDRLLQGVALLLLSLLLTTTRALDDVDVAGVPLPWLLHAYGYYPVIVAFAVVFAVAAARNERRFRALAEPDDPPGDDE